jgi:hypothetical protein
MTKDNIMKMTVGLFHKVLDKIGGEYPELDKERLIVDIGIAKVVGTAEFTDAVIERLGTEPQRSRGADVIVKAMNLPKIVLAPRAQKKDLVRVDIFLQ